ncbi:MAG: hypothetical protein HY721_28625 [Planctomycetes bacterium]|nr:hypothetical protein [Planctomycetota bacterium]
MRYSGKEIIDRIEAHFKKRRGKPGKWLVAVAPDARTRLRAHGVQKKGDYWIYMRASSPAAAKEARDRLLKSLGAVEGPQPEPGDCVYAYQRSSHTKP